MPEASETAQPPDFDPQQAIRDTVLHLAAMPIETDADLHAFNATLIAASRSCGKTPMELRRLVDAERARGASRSGDAGTQDTTSGAEARDRADAARQTDARRPKIMVEVGADALRFLADINIHGSRYREFRPGGLPVLYCQGTRLLRKEMLPPSPLVDGTSTGGRALLVRAEPSFVHNQLEDAFAFWEKKKKNGRWAEVPCGFPGSLLKRVIALAHEGVAQPVRGIATQPFVGSDGAVVRKNGYDAPSQILCEFPDFVGNVPARPTLNEAKDAALVLRKVLADFPFKTPSCLGAAVAFLLHAHLRHMLDVVPAWLVTAPESGSGKDLLVKAMTQFATGTIAYESVWPAKDEEQSKTLLTMAEQATNVAHFSNLPSGGPLASAILDQVITTPLIMGRRMGVNETITANNKMSLAFTGNMISVKGDTTRRVIVSTLAPGVEDPMNRTDFAIPNLVRWLRDNEPVVRAAMLTLAVYAVQSGASRPAPPHGYTPLASFGMWDTYVRRCVIDLLGPDHDPIITLKQRRVGAIYFGDRLVMRTLIDGLIENRIGTFSLGRDADAAIIADILQPLLEHQDGQAAGIVKNLFKEDRADDLGNGMPRSLHTNRVGKFIEDHIDHVSGNHQIAPVLDRGGGQAKVYTARRNRANLWMVVLVSRPDVPFTGEPEECASG
jgi:hypothetical protein